MATGQTIKRAAARPDSPELERPPHSPWRAVAVLMFIYAASMLDRMILDLLVDPVRRDLNVSDAKMGLLLGLAFALPYVLCSLPLGWASDRYPRRIIIALGLLIWGSATFACALSSSYGELFVARCFVGVGEAALLPAAYSIIGDLFPAKRLTLAISVFSMGAMVGIGTSLALGGWLVDLATTHGPADLGALGLFKPWQTVFLLTSIPALALIPCLLFLSEPQRRPAETLNGEGISLMSFVGERWKFLLCHIFGFSISYTAGAASSAWAPTYLSRTFNWSPAAIGSSLGMFVILFGVSGYVVSGRTVNWMVSKGVSDAQMRYPSNAVVAMGLVGALAPQVPWPSLAVIMFPMVSFFSTVGAMAAAALYITTPSHLRGSVAALFIICSTLLGQGTGPALAGLLTTHVFHNDAAVGNSITLIFIVCCTTSTLLLRRGARMMRDLLVRPIPTIQPREG